MRSVVGAYTVVRWKGVDGYLSSRPPVTPLAFLDNLIRTLDKHHRGSGHGNNKPVERIRTQSERKSVTGHCRW